MILLEKVGLRVFQNGEQIYELPEYDLSFDTAYIYLQMSSGTNNPSREVYFDNIFVQEISSGGGRTVDHFYLHRDVLGMEWMPLVRPHPLIPPRRRRTANMNPVLCVPQRARPLFESLRGLCVGVPATSLSSARGASRAASPLLAFITTFPSPPFPPRPLSVHRPVVGVAPLF